MPYTTKANLIARFGEQELIDRTDRAEPPMGALDDAVLQVAMDRADADIDDALRVRYAVPLASPPISLLTQAENRARRYLYDDGMPQAVKDGFDESTEWLKRVANGSLLLDAPAASTGTSGVSGSVGVAMFNESRNDFACRF